MLTKGDLLAIKNIFRDEIRTTVKSEVKTVIRSEVRAIVRSEVKTIVKDEVGSIVKTELTGVYGAISELRDELNKNTNTLVELITSGFSTHEAMFQNHEQRITHLETASFKQ